MLILIKSIKERKIHSFMKFPKSIQNPLEDLRVGNLFPAFGHIDERRYFSLTLQYYTPVIPNGKEDTVWTINPLKSQM